MWRMAFLSAESHEVLSLSYAHFNEYMDDEIARKLDEMLDTSPVTLAADMAVIGHVQQGLREKQSYIPEKQAVHKEDV